MRYRLLAAFPLLLGMAALAHADYLVIVKDLNASGGLPENTGPNKGMAGGMQGGMAGGMMPKGPMPGMQGGMAGGMTPPKGPMPGMQGGMAGGMMPPKGPMPGMQGGMAGGMTPPKGPMPGMQGGMQGGMMAPPGGMMMGRPGGMAGGMPGMMGGMMGGMMPGMGEEEAVDESPFLVVAVVEMTNPPSAGVVRQFNADLRPLAAKHHWGQTTLWHKKDPSTEVILVESSAGKPLPSIGRQFKTRHAELLKSPSTDGAIRLAHWALENGLIAEFESVMDELAKTDKGHSEVAAYLKVKEEMARPLPRSDAVTKWKGRALDGYKVAQSAHFAVLYKDSPNGCKDQLERLEKSFKGFYYWWAMRGKPRPMPAEPLVAVRTERADDFRRLQRNLTASPVLADSFEARREGLSVFKDKRGDAPFVSLDVQARRYWSEGFNRKEILRNLRKALPRKPNLDKTDVYRAPVDALLLKAMEEEWEATALSHESSRQLLFASGLLPRKVHVPEWVQFGMASFFEVPLQSPFGGPGGASPYWLPRFKEYKDAKSRPYGKSNYDVLVGVLTDAHFRAKPAPGETPEAALRRARAAAWALTYYLAKEDLDGLLRYCQELARLPRDVELDGKLLEAAFARAFRRVNPDRTPNRAAMERLASDWLNYMAGQRLEGEEVHKKIREFYARMKKSGPTTTPPPNLSTEGVPANPTP